MANKTKRYPERVQRSLVPTLGASAVLLGIAGFLQSKIDPTAEKYHKGETNIGTVSSGMNNEFMLLPLLGFREAAAGLLWVRCDEFFHSGDYDAILPLVRIITLLDPHAENVYVTGAWHLSYNFTDANERSDRRYIAPAMALLDEGIANNPDIPDIKFEKGWEEYDKVKNFAVAEEAFKSAIAGPHGDGSGNGDDAPYAAPLKTLHILAHTYEKQGRIPEALAEWKAAQDRSNKIIDDLTKKGKKVEFGVIQMLRAEQHNYDEALQRYHNRYLPDPNKHLHDNVNPSDKPAVLWPTGTNTPGPWDVAFVPKVEIKRPKVFKISGQLNAADGARVDVRITDWDYNDKPITGVLSSFNIDMSQTILVDSISERKTKFEREMDMSKDPKMYSFSQPYYRVILSYNPRTTSPHLQDRFGWSGEGITDNNQSHVAYFNNPELLGTAMIAGQGATGPVWDGTTVPWRDADGKPLASQPSRYIKVTYKISRDQIMALKPITDNDIVPN
ncbi:MAG TPA: hypothetical protein VKU00_00420 [Chthonomonadaceae bacterium]|nr:hypothetical protein [Chthonomonadaceae bacterium]